MPTDTLAPPPATTAAFDALLALPVFGTEPAAKRAALMAALNEAHAHHFAACAAYRRLATRRGFGPRHAFAAPEDLPFLPVQAFKDNGELLASVAPEQVHTRLRSSATSGVPSTVLVDKLTARRQVRTLAAVMAAVLGGTRRPFVVVDVDPRTAPIEAVGARGAAVRGFLNLAREVRYVMRPLEDAKGRIELDAEALDETLAAHAVAHEPVVVFGFTFVLYAQVLAPLAAAGRRFALPPGSKLVHIGGWKKLADQSVSREAFDAAAAQVFDIAPTDVHDFYGFTEQMGVTYPDLAPGEKCTPVFAEVVVRNPETFEPQPDGESGLLEFVTPLPYSYPGLAVLTDDVGVVTRRDAQGTHFRVLGRARQAEVRGCGDILGDKVATPARAAPAAPAPAAPVRAAGRPKLLFDASGHHAGGDLMRPIDLAALPDAGDLGELAARLRRERARLDAYSVDELAALIGAAAARWLEPGSALAPLRHIGLQFLAGWCAAPALRRMADASLGGARGVLDGFVPEPGWNRRLVKAQARGLVVHWLAGNVPLLGMLGVAQAILTRNANLLKAPSSFAAVLPALLQTFRGLEVTTHAGRVLRGDDVLATIAVVYFPRDDVASAEALSTAGDVRLAWGGREAIETILALPRRYGTEDIVFGPKLSYMAIGRDALASERALRRLARQAATDASVFDQYACASPHTIFVEKGGAAATPLQFAERLADEMARAAVRIPKAPVDAGTAAKVEALRMRHELTGELFRSAGTTWTVLYDEPAAPTLAEACYSRVITVRAVDDIQQAAALAHPGIQTIGLAMDGARKMAFANEAAARGAERFPDVGRMTHFDAPWDGLYPMDRLVRWVSLGGPF